MGLVGTDRQPGVYEWSNEVHRGHAFWSRRLSARVRVRPDYIIAGAGKCGTTAIQAYLCAHPKVREPLGKELHFFDHNYGLGEAWYRAHFPVAISGRTWMTGEATPYYLSHPSAAGRIARDLPDVKVVVLLRDPIERAFSQYQMVRNEYGCEDLTFEEALSAEEKRLAGEQGRMELEASYRSHAHLFYGYKERGRYAEHLEVWFEHFGRTQILVLRSEDFFADPGGQFFRLLDFLGLPRWVPPNFPVHNKGTYEQTMSAAARRRLGDYFAEPNRRLASLLGWRQPLWDC
jgi:hypothetical protein